MAHAQYPKRLYFDGKPAIRVFSADEETAVLTAHQAPDETDEAATIREKLAALGVPAPHHKTGLDRLRAILAEAEAAPPAKEAEPEPLAAPEPVEQ